MTFTLNQITNRAFQVIKEREKEGIFPLIACRFYFKLDRYCIIGSPRYQSSYYPFPCRITHQLKCKP